MNKLYKALIYDREVSLSVLETTQMVNDAIKTHNLDENSAKTLGGLLTCAAYMSGCLKSERGAVSLTVKGGGDAGTVSVSGDINLHIRGYIDGSRLNGGTLTVIKEDGFFRPFVGTSELTGDDVSQNLMKYFQMSEQIDTAVAIGVKIENGVCTAAGGVVMQLLPGTSEANMEKAEERMQAFVNAADVVEKFGRHSGRVFRRAHRGGRGIYLLPRVQVQLLAQKNRGRDSAARQGRALQNNRRRGKRKGALPLLQHRLRFR